MLHDQRNTRRRSASSASFAEPFAFGCRSTRQWRDRGGTREDLVEDRRADAEARAEDLSLRHMVQVLV